MSNYEVKHYLDHRACDLVGEWIAELRDGVAKVHIVKR